jgi:ATP-dependent exoDNAse (exonuclease V) alpha subunit
MEYARNGKKITSYKTYYKKFNINEGEFNKLDKFIHQYKETCKYICKKRNIVRWDTYPIIVEQVCRLLNIKYISFSTLNKIHRTLKYSLDPCICLTNLIKHPYRFLNEENQLISLNGYKHIYRDYHLKSASNEVKDGLASAFVYHTFIKTNRALYIPKYERINKDTYLIEFLQKKNKGIQMKPCITSSGTNSDTWFLYNSLEYEYLTFKEEFNLREWTHSDLGLITIQDNKRQLKELNKDPDFWEVPRGRYYTTKRFQILLNNLTDDTEQLCFTTNDDVESSDIDTYINLYEDKEHIKLEPKQRQAIHNCIKNNFNILSGYPGTGKTTVTKAILYVNNMIYKSSINYIGLAPTGKAMKNLEKALGDNGIPVRTIHKFVYYDYNDYTKYNNDRTLLEDSIYKRQYNEQELTLGQKMSETYFNRENPIEFIIVDETSMVDMLLYSKIIEIAKNSNAKLLFIGDPDQLPPIGAGEPFKDLCTFMDNYEIHGGNRTSLITIKRSIGKLPMVVKQLKEKKNYPIDSFDGNEMIFIPFTEFKYSIKNQKAFETLLCDTLDKYELDIYTLQANCNILTPQHGDKNDNKGDYIGGTIHINKMMQAKNAREYEVSLYGNKRYNGDRVIRTTNNYNSENVRVNGDTGTLYIYKDYQSRKKDDLNISVTYDDDHENPEELTVDELFEEFDLNYGITVHKKQGDENDNIIIILSPKHTMWLPRKENVFNLIYTAISRAKKRCIIIGDENVYTKMFQGNPISTTYTTFMKQDDEE